MMTTDPGGLGSAPLPRRLPRTTVGQLVEQLLAEDQDAPVRLMVSGAREVYAKGILVIDRDGNVVIC